MRPLVLIVPLALVLAACSGPSTKQVAPPTQTPQPSVVATTAAPTPSPTPSPTPTPTPKATPSRTVPAIDGDVDGDGKPDSIRTSATLLSVELSHSGRTVTAPIHAEAPRSAPVLGSKDIDRDGFAEVFLETAQGASTTFATPYRFDGKALHELQLDAGPVRLGIGGSVRHGDGFRCTPTGQLEVRSADSADGRDFTVHVSLYRLTATQLVLINSTTSRAKQGDASVENSYNVDCGSVGEGG